MNPELTQVCRNSVLGTFSNNRRLLDWDSSECHTEDTVTEALLCLEDAQSTSKLQM